MQLSSLSGIGDKTLISLAKIEIRKVNDLVSYFPIRYEDRTKLHLFKDFLALEDNSKEKLTVLATVVEHKYIHFRNGKALKIILYDGMLTASLVCFNRDYLKEVFTIDDEFVIVANFQYKYGELQSSNFEYTKKGSNPLSVLRIVPIYQLTEGLTQAVMRSSIYNALEQLTITETLPQYIREKKDLIPKETAFNELHFPTSYKSLDKAIYRMKYYELFELECNVALKKYFFTTQKKIKYQNSSESKSKKLISTLPFSLTNGQLGAISDIKKDMLSKYPMHRMLQGDVGCGKTVVCLIAMLLAIDNKKQTALMTPTEILAKQHYRNIKNLTKDTGINISLLTGNLKAKERRGAIEKIKSGIADMIIGTHALFSEEVSYKDLAFVVIDEQHKFGVLERGKLVSKGDCVDILLMSATPIPRSLSLTVYGDLELSLIKEKPKRKSSIESYFIFNEDKKNKMYDFINKEIEDGRQGFVVCPLIEDSEKLEISSAISTFDRLAKEHLPLRRAVLIHSKLSTMEKETIMEAFLKREYDVLVATTVIEVGLDIANASFMVIEDADRFGLSQLHQLRGRIGRGEHNSHCFFVAQDKDTTDNAKQRLTALLNHNDGFILAEEDLKIRGAGEFLGSKQTGLNSLRFASLIEDKDLLDEARGDAFELILNDPKLLKEEHSILQKTIYKSFVKNNRILLAN